MTNIIEIKYEKLLAGFCLVAALVFTFMFAPDAFAQGSGYGNGSGGSDSDSGSGLGDQTQDRDQDGDQDGDQDRDRIQDPATHDGDEPDQDRIQDQDQDQDRIQDSSLNIDDEPIQDRDQLRDRLHDQLTDPDQDQDRDRIRANDAAGLQELISTSEEVSEDIANGLGEEIRDLARNRTRVEVGVAALVAAQNMVGQYGQQVSDMAQEIFNAHQMMVQEEEQINSRSWFENFFFGGDSDSAQAIQDQLQQNEERMQQIRQYLDGISDVQVRDMLQEQIRNIEEEHARLQLLADEETSRWGLFNWRF